MKHLLVLTLCLLSGGSALAASVSLSVSSSVSVHSGSGGSVVTTSKTINGVTVTTTKSGHSGFVKAKATAHNP